MAFLIKKFMLNQKKGVLKDNFRIHGASFKKDNWCFCGGHKFSHTE